MKQLIVSLYDYPYGGKSANVLENGNLEKIELSEIEFDALDRYYSGKEIIDSLLEKYEEIIVCQDGDCVLHTRKE